MKIDIGVVSMKRVCVIGAGPGGYVAAIRLAQLGAEVHLIERDRVGGTCLNRGCIPTKTLFRTAEIMHEMKRAEEFGIEAVSSKVDYPKLYERKEKIVDTLIGGIEQLLKSYPNIKFYEGIAKVLDKNKVQVLPKDASFMLDLCEGCMDGGCGCYNPEEFKIEEIGELDAIIIANGSKPQMTETVGVELEGVITSDDLLALKELPKRLIVVGGGVIGLEFASIYKELGSEVVVLASRILKNADQEISKRLAPMLKKQGIELFNDVRAKSIEKKDEWLKVVAAYKKNGETFEVEGDYVLIASGRGPVYDGLPLDSLGIEYDAKGIIVNKDFETSVPGIYAIGDIVKDNPQLAHVASAQAEYVAEIIMGHEPDINLEIYPNCVFTLNEVAHAGYTEEELKEKGIAYKSSKFNFAANGKALCLGDGNGLVKMLADENGRLLGAHIIGPHANDLIAECTLALANNMSVDDVLRSIHAHPTLTETVLEATAGLFGKAIHIAKPKK